MAWLPGWLYRKPITISASQVDATLTNFPLRILLAREDVVGSQTSGIDIRFATSSGILLDYVWTGFTDDGYSGAYVKVPEISANEDTELYVYYGNATATENSNALSVLSDYVVFAPLFNHTSGQLELACGLSLTSSGVTAKSNGVDVDGGHITIGNQRDIQSALTGEAGLTYSSVFRDTAFLNQASGQDDYIVADKSSSTYWMVWAAMTNQYGGHFNPNGGYSGAAKAVITAADVLPTEDCQLAWTYSCYDGSNPGELIMYIDGSPVVSGTDGSTATSLSFGTPSRADQIGYYDTDRSVAATISEYRIKKGAASTAWIKFEYANLIHSDGEITWGETESLPTVLGPYQAVSKDTFQTNVQQSETYIPGIIAGHTYDS